MENLLGYGSSDDDEESTKSASPEKPKEKSDDEVMSIDDDEPEESTSVEETNVDAASEYSSQLRRMSCSNELHEITLPPAPPGQPDPAVVEKVRVCYMKMMNHGLDANENIKRKKSFRNPSIYNKLIDFLDIDEGGSNFPKDVFDPREFRNDKKNDYVAIANLQRVNEERRQAAMKERSKATLATNNATLIGGDLRSRFTTKVMEATMAAQKAASKYEGAAVVEKGQSSSSKRSISSIGQLAKDKSKSRK